MRGFRPTKPFRRLIKARGETYTVTRTTTQIDDVGETVTTETTHEAHIHIYKLSERPTQRMAGEHFNGKVMGLCLPSADIGVGDTIIHSDETYEVESKTGTPNDAEAVYYRMQLARQ